MDKKNGAKEAANTDAMSKGRIIFTYDDLTDILVETTDMVQDTLNELNEIIHCLMVIDPTRKDFLLEMDSHLEKMNLAMDEFHFSVSQYKDED